jgi:hypothetical protein
MLHGHLLAAKRQCVLRIMEYTGGGSDTRIAGFTPFFDRTGSEFMGAIPDLCCLANVSAAAPPGAR